MMEMTIGKTAKKAGVGVETIRFYERKGLIIQPLKPTSGGYRIYSEKTVDRVRFIRQAQELGFSLREIEELLTLQANPKADSGEVRKRAIAKIDEVSRKIGQLEDIRAALNRVVAVCPGSGSTEICSILDAMSGKNNN